MKNRRLLKELNLGVGITPNQKSAVKTNKFVSLGGFHSNADDVFSKRYSLVNEDDEESEGGYEMAEDILELRVYKNNQYQLTETLENLDEGMLQTGLDMLKAIPGLDSVVGNVELYMQAGQAKESFDALSHIISGLKNAAGLSALAIIGTNNQYKQLLSKFIAADEEDKISLKDGVEKILDVLKNMAITAAQTFDSVIALPSFAAAGVGGIAGETIANIVTSLGTFLRDQPVEQFVFKTLSKRSGIISKVVELFEKVLAIITGGGVIGKALGYVVKKISSAGGEVVELFLTKPFELLRRLGDLYKAAIGAPAKNIESPASEINTLTSKLNDKIFETKKHSILFLLEGFDNSKNETDHDNLESFEEIDLSEYSGAGAVAGYAIPQPGPNPNKPNTKKSQTAHHKLFEKQLEEVLRWQSFHQKTSNKLK